MAFASKDFKEAIRLYSLAMKGDIAPEVETIYYLNRADAYLQLDQYEECLDDCDAALINDPSNITAYLKRASALSAKGEPERAIEVLSVASKIDVNNTEPRRL